MLALHAADPRDVPDGMGLVTRFWQLPRHTLTRQVRARSCCVGKRFRPVGPLAPMYHYDKPGSFFEHLRISARTFTLSHAFTRFGATNDFA